MRDNETTQQDFVLIGILFDFLQFILPEERKPFEYLMNNSENLFGRWEWGWGEEENFSFSHRRFCLYM